ncbi:MAG: site-2 protease family protein [Hyphomicrobium sp.]
MSMNALPLLSQLWFLICELLRAPFDVLLGRQRRSYTLALDVAAPKPVTWAIASAHSLRLEGTPPIEIVTTPDPNRPGVYTGRLRIGQLDLPMAYRVLEERPGEAMSLAVIKAESAPECCPGDDYVCAFAVTGDDAASTIISTYEVTHTRFASRLLMPFAVIQNIRRLKHNAELRTGADPQAASAPIKNALVTGALTFASFFAMFGLQAAAMLIFLILIHEVGHVIAMRWVGMPVKGIYFVPFFGGVAVSGDRYRSEAERGLVALMGPGFSLLTTAVFFAFAAGGNDKMMGELALMSALLNGFNLLPVLPLDGGHVAQSLLSRFSAGTARVFHIAALLAGGALALAIKSYLLLFILLIVAPSLGSERAHSARMLPALTWMQWALLFIAYTATFVFYIDVAVQLAGSTMPVDAVE